MLPRQRQRPLLLCRLKSARTGPPSSLLVVHNLQFCTDIWRKQFLRARGSTAVILCLCSNSLHLLATSDSLVLTLLEIALPRRNVA